MVISLTTHLELSAGKQKKKVETQMGWDCGQWTIDQGSRALTQTAFGGDRQPTKQKTQVGSKVAFVPFFFFCQHSCVCPGFRFQQPHIWELHTRTVNRLVSWPWDPTLSLPDVRLK